MYLMLNMKGFISITEPHGKVKTLNRQIWWGVVSFIVWFRESLIFEAFGFRNDHGTGFHCKISAVYRQDWHKMVRNGQKLLLIYSTSMICIDNHSHTIHVRNLFGPRSFTTLGQEETWYHRGLRAQAAVLHEDSVASKLGHQSDLWCHKWPILQA